MKKEHPLRTYFFSGLVLLLPLVLTIIIVVFLINLLTNPFANTVAGTLNDHDIFNKPFLFLTGQQVLHMMSKLIVLIGLFLLTLAVGMLGGWVLVGYLFKFADYLLHRTPLINKIYKGAQDVVTTVFEAKGGSKFSKVVLVPFPYSHSYNIGLITSSSMKESSDDAHKHLISVFVPGTPNPAMGFMLLFRKEQLIPVEMKVDEALKFVVSCGVICPKFTLTSESPSIQDISGN